MRSRFLRAALCTFVGAGCGGDTPAATQPTKPAADTVRAPVSPPPDPQALLTDEQLRTDEDPQASSEDPEWSAWVNANAVPIRSLTSDNFSDLQFLKPLLDGKRIVQLGESGHGVGQFDAAKVRLIKFLHEELGYDVIAFESGLFECWDADARASTLDVSTLMRSCIFAVWHAAETAPLFEYIQKTKQTDRPLTLAGFDVQLSSVEGAARRPPFLRHMAATVDTTFAKEIMRVDSTYILGWISSAVPRTWFQNNRAMLDSTYARHAKLMRDNQATLSKSRGIEAARVAQAVGEYTPAATRELAEPQGSYESGTARDSGMARNVTFLRETLYPTKKMIVWAHNYHVRYDNANTTAPFQANPSWRTMGAWIADRHRAETYSIGLFMYRGAAKQLRRDLVHRPDDAADVHHAVKCV